jgi:CBS-domain-containing membrane protein
MKQRFKEWNTWWYAMFFPAAFIMPRELRHGAGAIIGSIVAVGIWMLVLVPIVALLRHAYIVTRKA